MTNTTWRSGVCAAVLAMAVAPGVFSADWTTIYDENFSSDPGWVSNNPANYYWDSGAGNFFERQVDASGEYAYKLLPDLTQGFHWKLEFDIQPLSNTGAGNRRLSLTSSDMVVSGTPSQPFITLDFNNFNDQIQLLWNDSANYSSYEHIGTTYVFTQGEWYRASVEWNPSTATLSATVRERDTLDLVGTTSATGLATFNGIDRLAMSTLNDNFSGTGEARFDNINVSQMVPEPGSALLLAVGLAVVAGRRGSRVRCTR